MKLVTTYILVYFLNLSLTFLTVLMNDTITITYGHERPGTNRLRSRYDQDYTTITEGLLQ
jgi:hypothetical protein